MYAAPLQIVPDSIGTAGVVRAESRNIHRQRPIHEKSCLKGCLKLFRRPPPTPKYPYRLVSQLVLGDVIDHDAT